MSRKTAVIIGAGPGGLTAAHELLEHTDVAPVVLEMSDALGGIARTVNYKGNRIDIGGHRFFSKSDRVMDWWLRMMPMQGAPSKDERLLKLSYQGAQRTVPRGGNGPDPESTDRVMLVRRRLSRIYFLRRFFNYPLTLDVATLAGLGAIRVARIGASYVWSRLVPIRPEKSLEDFFINRFGGELYRTFFKAYTEKVWGVPCSAINPEWGAQRVKGLSIGRAIAHALRSTFVRRNGDGLVDKGTETSLIERFLYPKLGPGQMWEETARVVRARGGTIEMNQRVVRLHCEGRRVTAVDVQDAATGRVTSHAADYVLSTMPVKDLVTAMGSAVPEEVAEVSAGLVYRDFITVGLLLDRLKIKNETGVASVNNIVPDNWIYIQEPDVQVGRLQIFNNWSPYMVSDLDKVWIGLEYFVNEGDELWRLDDRAMADLGAEELARIGIIERGSVLDSVVIRMPKTYPAYVGSYHRFDVIQRFVDRFENLFLIGRNGMHRYNNQDHSMLTAMIAVENIARGITTKDNIWNVNVEQDYHEEK